MHNHKHQNNASQGFVLVYIVVAIVVMSAIGMAITGIATSSNNAQVSMLQTINARYMAESGMLYAKGLISAYEDQNRSIDETITALNANSGTVTVTGAGSFTINAAKSGSDIVITSTGRAKSGVSTVTLPQSATVTYSTGGTSAAESQALKGTYSGVSAIVFGQYSGNVTTNSATVGDGSIIKGSLNYLGTSASCLSIKGGSTVGIYGADTYTCSDSCVNVYGGATVYGDINAQGDVYVASLVYGDIHSGGNVTLDWGATVYGDIYVHGTFTQPNHFYGLHGTVYKNSPAPNMCATYTLPPHATVTSNNNLVINGDYTFTGKTDLADKTYSFKSISSNWGSRICFDLATPGSYINIWDKGNLSSNSDIYVRTSATTNCFDLTNWVGSVNFARYSAASRVYMDVGGTVSFGGSRAWFGTVYAAGNIYPSSGGFNIGAYYTNQAYNPSTTWTYSRFVLSDYVATYWP
jgi:hypothetical protein